MSNLLVIDFDFFFPITEHPDENNPRGDWHLYDWGHAENAFFIEHAWDWRATPFLRSGIELPGLNGEEKTFWDRFKFSDDAVLWIAESNCMAISNEIASAGVRELWLYDAHHDAGYKDEDYDSLVDGAVWSCENWMVYYDACGTKLHMRYPRWRHYGKEIEPRPLIDFDRQVDDGTNPDIVFDQAFLCRSGAWVPPWVDADFVDFYMAFPGDEVTEIGDYPLKPRWDDSHLADLQHQAEQEGELFARMSDKTRAEA